MPSLPAREVQEAINKAGYRWEARDTRISELARTVRAGGLFGLNIGEPERQKLMTEAITASTRFKATVPAPPKLDWRNNKGNWVTDIRYQVTCGSCVAHATCAAMESRSLISVKRPDTELNLSESHLFACGGGSCANGWNYEPALRQAQSEGVGLEQDFPYQPRDVACQHIAAKVKVTQWAPISAMNARKLAIGKGPVIAGMRVFSDFFSYGGGIYKHATGDFEGLHAIAVVGYSDPDSCWIIKNSWDKDWGERGFARLGYGECGIDSEFPFFDADITILGTPIA